MGGEIFPGEVGYWAGEIRAVPAASALWEMSQPAQQAINDLFECGGRESAQSMQSPHCGKSRDALNQKCARLEEGTRTGGPASSSSGPGARQPRRRQSLRPPAEAVQVPQPRYPAFDSTSKASAHYCGAANRPGVDSGRIAGMMVQRTSPVLAPCVDIDTPGFSTDIVVPGSVR
jgi:hypothetical protein